MTIAWMTRAGRRVEDLAERLRILLRPGLRSAAEAIAGDPFGRDRHAPERR